MCSSDLDVDRLVGGIEVLRRQESTRAKLGVEHFAELASPIITKGRCRVGGAFLEVAAEALFDDPSRFHDIGEIIGVNLSFLHQTLRASKTRRRDVTSNAEVASSIDMEDFSTV